MSSRMLFFDTETSGFSHKAGHKIIEIGVVEVIDGRFTGNEFHVYLDPQRAIDERAEQVHGISLEMLRGKPLFRDVAQDFLDFVAGSNLVAHNMPFDEGHIDNELALAGFDVKLADVAENLIDSMDLAKELFPGKKLNLDALCDKLQIDRHHRTSHGAIVDCKLLAQVTMAMLEKKAIIEQVANNREVSAPSVSITEYATVRFVAPDKKQLEHAEFLKRIGREPVDVAPGMKM